MNKADLKKLLDALKPFAKRCEDYEHDNEACGRYNSKTPLELEGVKGGLTVGDLRRAYKAYLAVKIELEAGLE